MRGHSLIDLFTRFARMGAEWVMWVLVALSVVSLALIVERARSFRRLRDDAASLASKLADALAADDLVRARSALTASPSPAARVALAGLALHNRGPRAMQHAMNASQTQTRKRLELNLTVLNTIGSNAPFIGLFGTVLGIIQAFDALKPPPGLKGAAAAAAASQANSQVMGTIAEALTATAIGLLVAIPAVAAFNMFQRRIKSMMGEVDALAETVLTYAEGTPRTVEPRAVRESEDETPAVTSPRERTRSALAQGVA